MNKETNLCKGCAKSLETKKLLKEHQKSCKDYKIKQLKTAVWILVILLALALLYYGGISSEAEKDKEKVTCVSECLNNYNPEFECEQFDANPNSFYFYFYDGECVDEFSWCIDECLPFTF